MADLIVRARLTDMTTRLSDDETTVFRDFTVLPMAVIKQPQVQAVAGGGCSQTDPHGRSVVNPSIEAAMDVDSRGSPPSFAWDELKPIAQARHCHNQPQHR